MDERERGERLLFIYIYNMSSIDIEKGIQVSLFVFYVVSFCLWVFYFLFLNILLNQQILFQKPSSSSKILFNMMFTFPN